MPATGANGRIRAVLFDLGGTLIDVRDPPAWVEIAGELGLTTDLDHLMHAFEEAERVTEGPTGSPTQVEFWRLVLSGATEATVDDATVRRFLERLYERAAPAHLFSDVRRCLDELRRDGRKLGVVSNSKSEPHTRALLERGGILPYFPVVLSSGTEGVSKPDPEIFRRAVDRMGVAVHEAFYVGDLPYTDAKGAAKAGLASVWLHRAGTGFGDDPPEITSLTELPRWIRLFEGRPR